MKEKIKSEGYLGSFLLRSELARSDLDINFLSSLFCIDFLRLALATKLSIVPVLLASWAANFEGQDSFDK